MIERAFGLLVNRRGIFWRRMNVSLKKVPQLVIICASFQNFLINESEIFASNLNDIAWGPVDNDCICEPLLRDQLTEGPRPGPRRDREKSRRRIEMTKNLEYLGRLRPAPVRRASSACKQSQNVTGR